MFGPIALFVFVLSFIVAAANWGDPLSQSTPLFWIWGIFALAGVMALGGHLALKRLWREARYGVTNQRLIVLSGLIWRSSSSRAVEDLEYLELFPAPEMDQADVGTIAFVSPVERCRRIWGKRHAKVVGYTNPEGCARDRAFGPTQQMAYFWHNAMFYCIPEAHKVCRLVESLPGCQVEVTSDWPVT
jgi:hypothetical protein